MSSINNDMKNFSKDSMHPSLVYHVNSPKTGNQVSVVVSPQAENQMIFTESQVETAQVVNQIASRVFSFDVNSNKDPSQILIFAYINNRAHLTYKQQHLAVEYPFKESPKVEKAPEVKIPEDAISLDRLSYNDLKKESMKLVVNSSPSFPIIVKFSRVDDRMTLFFGCEMDAICYLNPEDIMIGHLNSLVPGGGSLMMDLVFKFAEIGNKKSVRLDSAYGSWPFYFSLGLRTIHSLGNRDFKRVNEQMLIWHGINKELFTTSEIDFFKEVSVKAGISKDKDKIFLPEIFEERKRNKIIKKNENKFEYRGDSDQFMPKPIFEEGVFLPPLDTIIILETSGKRSNSNYSGDMVPFSLDVEEWKNVKDEGFEVNGSVIREIGKRKIDNELIDLRRRMRILNEKYFEGKYQISNETDGSKS